MKSLPANLILQKNKLSTASAWLVLLEITLNDIGSTVVRLVQNNANITFGGNVYTAFNFELEPMTQDHKGSIPTVSLRVSNVTQVLQPYMSTLAGGVGSAVKIIVVNTEYLSESYTELEMEFNVLAADTTADWVTFTLGSTNPLKRRFPLYKFIGMHCRWKYKTVECGYAGAIATCDKTLTDCRTHSNSGKFGGFPCMRSKSVRIV